MNYNITEIHYRDIYGNLLWKEKMIFRRLYGIGDVLIHESKGYSVARIAVADNIQHVNLKE